MRFNVKLIPAILIFAAGSAWAHGAGGGFGRDDEIDVERGCSIGSLRGAYAISGRGMFVAESGAPLPFRTGDAVPVDFLNRTVFDGNGNLQTPSGTDVYGGTIETDVPTTGTYTIRPDCTGTMTLHTQHTPDFGGPHTHNLQLVVVDRGRRFYFLIADHGANGSGIGERIK